MIGLVRANVEELRTALILENKKLGIRLSITLDDGAIARPSTTFKSPERPRTANTAKVLTEFQAISQTMPETIFRDAETVETFTRQSVDAFAHGTLKEQYVLIRHVPWDVFDSLLIRSVRLYYDSGELNEV